MKKHKGKKAHGCILVLLHIGKALKYLQVMALPGLAFFCLSASCVRSLECTASPALAQYDLVTFTAQEGDEGKRSQLWSSCYWNLTAAKR